MKDMDVGSQNNSIITANNVAQHFKVGENQVEALRSCSFEIQDSTFTIIYGPSGSGKSTLLNVLSGLQKPSTGEVLYKQKNLYNLKPGDLAKFRSNEIGIIYQQMFWVTSLNVVENVALPLYFAGYSRPAAKKHALDSLQKVDLVKFAQYDPRTLSGGEQQRVGVARAIVNNPSLIIADEPTGSLDSRSGDMIMSLLQSFKRDYNRTVILVTHNMEYLSLADRLLNISDGVVQNLASDDIVSTTKQLVTGMQGRIESFAKLKQGKNRGKS